MEKNYEYRFELKPGKHVFIPTKEGASRGRRIVGKLLQKWTPREYFYHFHKRGGHIAALRPHVEAPTKASADLTSFFPSISRTRVHRALKSIGFSNRYALDLATESCVEYEGRKFLPYGFVQSMALATLSVEKSLLGQKISEIRGRGGNVTMYVDDILISGADYPVVRSYFDQIVASAVESGFAISEEKSTLPGPALRAFNCEIDGNDIRILDERMEKFIEDGLNSGEHTRAAILRYVGVLNAEQMGELSRIFS